MSTQPEFSKSTGPTSGDGETLPRFLPTPRSSGAMAENLGSVKRRLAEGRPYKAKLEEAVATGMLTSSAAAFLASPSLLPDNDGAKMMSVGSGTKCVEFARYSDQHGCWLKTSQGYFQQEMFRDAGEPSSEEWCETWPRSGIVCDGIAYRLPPLVPRISGTGCSLWGTPQAHERAQSPRAVDHGVQLANQVAMWPTPKGQYSGRTPEAHQAAKQRAKAKHAAGKYAKGCGVPTMDDLQTRVGGQLNPTWVEWLMGFPLGWTDLDALGTP